MNINYAVEEIGSSNESDEDSVGDLVIVESDASNLSTSDSNAFHQRPDVSIIQVNDNGKSNPLPQNTIGLHTSQQAKDSSPSNRFLTVSDQQPTINLQELKGDRDPDDVMWKISFPSTSLKGSPQETPHTFRTRTLSHLEYMLREKKRLLQKQIAFPYNVESLHAHKRRCGACWLLLPSSNAYNRHIEYCPLSCQNCGELFNDPDQLRCHRHKSFVEDCKLARTATNRCKCCMCT